MNVDKKLRQKIPDLNNLMHRNPNLATYIAGIRQRGTITAQDWKTIASFPDVHIKQGGIRIINTPNPGRW